ncbi:MAG: hypothetical protein ABR601_03575 [Parasphingopyxis sp.]|nr:hypothetical protein [Sphingomonadales bacterium]
MVLLAMLQATSADRIAFVCQDDKGEAFSIDVPAVIEEGERPDPADYSVESLDVDGAPDEVFDNLPEDLELNWRPADEPQVRLEIDGYDVIGHTAAYRLYKQSPPGEAISWSSYSSGQCLGRRIAGDTADARQGGNDQ